MNIILIVVDSLRVLNIGCYGYGKPTTPNIDSLASESVLFENAFACCNNSDSSMMTILSGKYPRSHGIVTHGSRLSREDLKKLPETPLLPEIMQQQGYRTLAVSPLGCSYWVPFNSWHRRGYNSFYHCYFSGGLTVPPKLLRVGMNFIDSVFGHLRFTGRSVRTIHKALGFDILSPKRTTDLAVNLIQKNYRKNFFLLIDYMTAHSPWLRPSGFDQFFQNFLDKKESIGNNVINEQNGHILKTITNLYPELANILRETPRINDYLTALYDGAIALIDYHIGILLKFLKESGIIDKTLIILTADHGRSLNEHGIFFDTHGLYDETIHIPLLIRVPGAMQKKRIKSLVQHVDIVPTVLDLAGVSMPNAFDGNSLGPLITNEKKQLRSMIYAEEGSMQWTIAIRSAQYKYIYAPSPECMV